MHLPEVLMCLPEKSYILALHLVQSSLFLFSDRCDVFSFSDVVSEQLCNNASLLDLNQLLCFKQCHNMLLCLTLPIPFHFKLCYPIPFCPTLPLLLVPAMFSLPFIYKVQPHKTLFYTRSSITRVYCMCSCLFIKPTQLHILLDFK